MKLELKHLTPYLPYGINVKYKGIVNGKELGKWDRENKDLEFFDEPETPKPDEVIDWKMGLIKKTETYLEKWILRIGNGHKYIHPNSFGKEAFLLLHSLSKLTDEQIGELENHHNFSMMHYSEIKTDPTRYPFTIVEKLFEWHFDVFGLIEKGLAEPIEISKAKRE